MKPSRLRPGFYSNAYFGDIKSYTYFSKLREYGRKVECEICSKIINMHHHFQPVTVFIKKYATFMTKTSHKDNYLKCQ